MTPPQSYFAKPDNQRLEAVFYEYVAQGSGRNITWLASRTGLPLAVIGKAMVEGMWLQRIQAIGKDAAAATRDRAAAATGKLVGDVAGMNERDISRMAELEEIAYEQLMARLRGDSVVKTTMKDESLINTFMKAVSARRKMMGLEEGAPPTNPLQKLLEGSLTGNGEAQPALPFTLDPKKLEAPKELPAMPGMTSDAPEEDPDRELDDDEKELLRP